MVIGVLSDLHLLAFLLFLLGFVAAPQTSGAAFFQISYMGSLMGLGFPKGYPGLFHPRLFT